MLGCLSHLAITTGRSGSQFLPCLTGGMSHKTRETVRRLRTPVASDRADAQSKGFCPTSPASAIMTGVVILSNRVFQGYRLNTLLGCKLGKLRGQICLTGAKKCPRGFDCFTFNDDYPLPRQLPWAERSSTIIRIVYPTVHSRPAAFDSRDLGALCAFH